MRDIAGAAPTLFLHLAGEGDAGAIDEAVGDEGGDDLAAQPMLLDRRAIALDQRRREVAQEIADQLGVVGERRGQELGVERHLGVGQQDGELGPRQADPCSGACRQSLVVGQELDRARQLAVALEAAHQADLLVERIGALPFGEADRLALQIIVAQHERGHLVGHLGELLVAPGAIETALGDHRVEQDLEIDLVVGGVDAGRVVDRVGVDAAALERIFDAAALGHAEIGALADDARGDLLAP